jgi:hypothetical protein
MKEVWDRNPCYCLPQFNCTRVSTGKCAMAVGGHIVSFHLVIQGQGLPDLI